MYKTMLVEVMDGSWIGEKRRMAMRPSDPSSFVINYRGLSKAKDEIYRVTPGVDGINRAYLESVDGIMVKLDPGPDSDWE